MADDGRTENNPTRARTDFRIYGANARLVGENPTIHPYTPSSFADPKIASHSNIDPNFEALGLGSKALNGLSPEEMRNRVNFAYRKRAREISKDPEELKRVNMANDNLRKKFGISR
ncbi:MAG: hypothetical protein ACHQT7_00970 [Candidatus Levyibacteriota bacterium]